MYARIHNQFGTAGMILSVVAIVLALAGGAIAASSGKRGPRGPRGKTGKTGPQGLAGTNGTNGKDGAPGKDGTNGTDGADGQSVTTASFVGNLHGCDEGGLEVVAAGGTEFVCNGKKGTDGTDGTNGTDGTDGTNGTDGSPWTVGGILPPGETETGAWGGTSAEAADPISFTLPLPEALSSENAHIVPEGGPAPAGCTGGTAGHPTADPGHLCVYVGGKGGAASVNGIYNAALNFTEGVGRAGAYVYVSGDYATGTWAVTAPLAGP